MIPTKQTVYLPVKVEDELPAENVLCIAEEFNGIAAGKLEVNPRGIISCDTDTIGCTVNYISHWLKEQQAFVFTPEQLNEYTQSVIKQALETAAESKSLEMAYTEDGLDYKEMRLSKQSITDTFEETFKLYQV